MEDIHIAYKSDGVYLACVRGVVAKMLAGAESLQVHDAKLIVEAVGKLEQDRKTEGGTMFRKIRFIAPHAGVTAGLVIGPKQTNWTITELSRLFPLWEAMKMKRLQSSPFFSTFEEAFSFSFED